MLALLPDLGLTPAAVAGHSMGAGIALVAAGTLLYGEQSIEGLALEILHGNKVTVVDLADVEGLDAVGMV